MILVQEAKKHVCVHYVNLHIIFQLFFLIQS